MQATESTKCKWFHLPNQGNDNINDTSQITEQTKYDAKTQAKHELICMEANIDRQTEEQ